MSTVLDLVYDLKNIIHELKVNDNSDAIKMYKRLKIERLKQQIIIKVLGEDLD